MMGFHISACTPAIEFEKKTPQNPEPTCGGSVAPQLKLQVAQMRRHGALEGEVTGGAALLSGEEHSSHSERKKKKKKNRKLEREMQPRSGCQLGAHLIEYAMPFEVLE